MCGVGFSWFKRADWARWGLRALDTKEVQSTAAVSNGTELYNRRANPRAALPLLIILTLVGCIT